MEIQYKCNDTCTVEEVKEVFVASGIRRPVDETERLQRMISNADIIVTARVDRKLIGFLRAITDYSYCCYISDIAISKAYQGQGIGKKLVEILKGFLGEEEVQYVLLSAPGATEFYGKIGFERADKAFLIRRKRNF